MKGNLYQGMLEDAQNMLILSVCGNGLTTVCNICHSKVIWYVYNMYSMKPTGFAGEYVKYLCYPFGEYQ
jgi:hypothetical protein